MVRDRDQPPARFQTPLHAIIPEYRSEMLQIPIRLHPQRPENPIGVLSVLDLPLLELSHHLLLPRHLRLLLRRTPYRPQLSKFLLLLGVVPRPRHQRVHDLLDDVAQFQRRSHALGSAFLGLFGEAPLDYRRGDVVGVGFVGGVCAEYGEEFGVGMMVDDVAHAIGRVVLVGRGGVVAHVEGTLFEVGVSSIGAGEGEGVWSVAVE
mmetsp:Transcript_6121/g.11911  ORF Transcript_6121/g.11911 Transcript_6121/m.11911 type:complete len:206 (-) Transcript_6121:337-954(-)